MKKWIIYAVLGAVLLLAVFFGGSWTANSFWKEKQKDPVEQSQILVEKINKVCKLVTVEGHFVEHYDYGDPPAGPVFIGPFINWDALWPRKSARLRVRAKVLVGYDLGRIQVEALPEEKTITISNLPQPDILSVDHEIDYFDKTESIFRPLTGEDYVKIGKGAEEKIREAARQSDLLKAAQEQGNELFDLIEFMVTNAGWTLVVRQEEPAAGPDSLWGDF